MRCVVIWIAGSNGDQVDKFRYDAQGRKTLIRQVPAPEQGPRAFGIAAWFECISESDTLTDGGTIYG